MRENISLKSDDTVNYALIAVNFLRLYDPQAHLPSQYQCLFYPPAEINTQSLLLISKIDSRI